MMVTDPVISALLALSQDQRRALLMALRGSQTENPQEFFGDQPAEALVAMRQGVEKFSEALECQ